MTPTSPAAIDIHEADYCALNCRAGITAGILVAQWGVDPAPMYFRTPIDPTDVLAPAERGEIAGFTFGNVPDSWWAELLGVRIEEWRASSAGAMRERLAAELARGSLVLASHDGYFDPLAADKHRRSHTRHNSLVYGVAEDGHGYLVADRGYRSTMSADLLWECSEPELAYFVQVTEATPCPVEAAVPLLGEGLGRLAAAVEHDIVTDGSERIVAAAAADVADRDGRWQQTHAFLAGVGRSRALFAQALHWIRQALPPGEGPEGQGGLDALAVVVAAACDPWLAASRLVYKHVVAGRPVPVSRLTDLLERAAAADRAVARRLAVEASR